jgi:hypothetical protein
MLSSATKIDNSPAVADCGLRVTWFFCVGGTAEMGWDWQRLGAASCGTTDSRTDAEVFGK